MPIPPIVPSSSTIVSSASSAHTIQAFIELVYVKTANNVMNAQMASLESALGYTESAMNVLTKVQNLHNQVSIESFTQFSNRVNTGFGTKVMSAGNYQKFASAHFGGPLQVIPDPASGMSNFLAELLTVRGQVSQVITQLSQITPLVGSQVDETSLLAKMRIVLQDLDANDITNANQTTAMLGAAKWLIDNNNAVSGAALERTGSFQKNITSAMTAGESLNTTQTESVRNYLYLFEEYYKSASAVLTAISQIITKMAQNIAR